jgi:coenzyme F420 biosynthesis associated uncharacterized protein
MTDPSTPVSMIDWELAARIGAQVAGPGPVLTRREAESVVAELRESAERSTPLVREFTGLTAEERTAPVLVVDRPGWIQANIDAFGRIFEPITAKLQERSGPPSALSRAVGSRVTGAEIGGVLGFLGSKVLGQFDPFSGSGRLLLVAPNIVAVEQQIEAFSSDFRLWVCLHEETHRVQFTAVPWMRDHMLGVMNELVDTVQVDPSKLAELVGDAVRNAGQISKGGGQFGLLEFFTTPEQRLLMARATALMSLLEGHADVVMDGIGPEVIPTVGYIRRRVNQRRKGLGFFDRLLRRLLGLEAKMAQYRDGAAFVNGVVALEGMTGFNQVWAAPDNLPTPEEIETPRRWVERVLG